MKINVTKEDIKTSRDPIGQAVRRQHGLEAHTDKGFIVFTGNEKFPRRLPLSAQQFNYQLHVGETVEPFEFEI